MDAQAEYYHGQIDRATTDTILAGKRPGTYLLRDSSTCPGDFVLSVSENNKVSHYIISRRGGLYIIGDQTFSDLYSVIEFYKKHFLDTTTLTDVAKRPSRPAPPDISNQPPEHVLGRLVVRGKFDFHSDDPEDLCFKKGELLNVLRKDEEEWWFAEKQSNHSTGSIPVPYIEIVEERSSTGPFIARALLDRDCPYDPSALSFKKGEEILVTHQKENGEWEGEVGQRRGHFPFKLVEVISNSRQ